MKWIFRAAVLGVVSCLSVTAPGAVFGAPWVVASSIEAGRVIVDVVSGDYRIIDWEEGHRVRMEDCAYLAAPGKPLLPAKRFLIALPPGARVTSVEAEGIGATDLPGRYQIEPAPPPIPLADPVRRAELLEEMGREWRNSKEEAYSSDLAYPREIVTLAGSGTLRKYAYASISFCPFRYHPQSGRLIHYEGARVVIHCTLPQAGSVEAQRIEDLKRDTAADLRASTLFENYSRVRDLYRPGDMSGAERDETYDYVVITTDANLDAFDASDFLGWKTALGYSIRVLLVTDPEITGQPGADLAEQIRNFLRAYYGLWGIEYVLLVGNYDAVPMRYCYPDPNYHAHNPSDPSNYGGSVPTDYYYADLSLPDADSWDSDGDGYPGEYTEDNPDFLAEVYVGRIPVNNNARITYALNKIVLFEQDNGDWKDRALHGASIAFYENEDYSGYPKVDFADYMNAIETDIMTSWTISHYSEQEGLDPSVFAWPALTQTAFTSDWRSGQYGVVNWGGHGWPAGGSRTIWAWDDGDGVPEHGNGELESAYILCCDDVLEDDYPSIVFGVGCSVGYPEPNALGRMGVDLLTRPGWGAGAAVITASRSAAAAGGWPDFPGGVQSLCYEFDRFLISGPSGPEKVGDALYDSKHYCHVNFGWDHIYEFKNLFDHNLYGDPAMAREGFPTAIEPDIPVASGKSLHIRQNRPNPFNLATEIRYSLPAGCRVKIAVFNIRGQRVMTLVDEVQQPGLKSVRWDGRNMNSSEVPSGVYFYRIQAGEIVETRRMVLLR
ncbi:MAG: T9SS type A sorting domain-containing protein [Candidatus Eisenbacteria sp.]|nr:T9SS type A sorting domain-containing protein [Candidatus Eisenbacteria bacterium]